MREKDTPKTQIAGVCVLIIVILSVLDGMLTLHGINEGKFVELNPFADLLISVGHLFFIFVKIILVALGTLTLLYAVKYSCEYGASAFVFLFVAVVLYGAVCIYQVVLLLR